MAKGRYTAKAKFSVSKGSFRVNVEPGTEVELSALEAKKLLKVGAVVLAQADAEDTTEEGPEE